MMENGNYISDIPEARTQKDLCQDHFDKGNASLSGRFWPDPVADLVCDIKQYETRQKLADMLDAIKNKPPGILGSAQFWLSIGSRHAECFQSPNCSRPRYHRASDEFA